MDYMGNITMSLLAAPGFRGTVPQGSGQTVTIMPATKVILPFASGSTTDLVASGVAAQLATRLGNTVVL